MQLARQLSQVLTRVIEIDNLRRAGKMLLGKIPDPFGAIAHDDLLCRAVPAALPGFQAGTFAGRRRTLDSATRLTSRNGEL
jgi:hypothetical protein